MIKRISSGSPFEAVFGYSRAIVDGDMIYVSGTTGYDYETMIMPAGVADQCRNILNTITQVLGDADAALGDVVRVRYYLTDVDFVDDVMPVLGEYFGEIRPAATMVIAGLIKPEMKIEIEVTVRRGASVSS